MNDTEENPLPVPPVDPNWKPGIPPKPTVAELEAILESKEPLEIQRQADGSIKAVPASPTNGQPSHLWFRKVMFATTFYIDRQPVVFEPLDQNTGVLKIAADHPQAAGLLAAAHGRRGGIVLIDEGTFFALKKKLPFKLLAPKSKRHVLQAFQTEPPALRPRNQNGAGAAAAVTSRISGRPGVGPVGGGGTGDESGKMPPVPAPPPAAPGEFIPATKRKSELKLPVTKKPSGRSLHSLAPDEPETAPAE